MNKYAALFGFTATLLLSCSSLPDSFSTDCDLGQCDSELSTPAACVAIRGNGPLLSSHWHSLARIVEEYGAPQGFAGGSSASITAFLYESILMNPAVADPMLRDNRVALLLKSLIGVPTAFKREVDALNGNFPLIEQLNEFLSEELDNTTTASVSTEKLAETSNQIVRIIRESVPALSNDTVGRSIINPEFTKLMKQSSENLKNGVNTEASIFVLNDLIESIKNFGSFAAPTDRMFIRPGLVNFKTVAFYIGKFANFYAGGDYSFVSEQAMNAWLGKWSTKTRGLTWPEIETEFPECVSEFSALLKIEQDQLLLGETMSENRLVDSLGEQFPTLITTSIIQGDGILEIEQAKDSYLKGIEPNIDMNWDDVRFGYWGGNGDDVDAIDGLIKDGDPKGDKADALGQTTWWQALTLSPAEPGLASALPLGDGRLSAGGWSDLHPVNALSHLPGCEDIIFVTRRGRDSNFAQGTAMALGLDDTAPFSDLTLDGSSFSRALSRANVTWCTDWDTKENLDFVGIAEDAYRAPAQVNASIESHNLERYMSYENASENISEIDRFDATGCTPTI